MQSKAEQVWAGLDWIGLGVFCFSVGLVLFLMLYDDRRVVGQDERDAEDES